jgi:hypothetical protein
MRFSGSVRLRPVRIGFLVSPAELPTVRRILRLCSCLWGGRYNPIIPFFDDTPQRWKRPNHEIGGLDIARGYIDFFEPDVLVEASPGMAERLGWKNDHHYFELSRVFSWRISSNSITANELIFLLVSTYATLSRTSTTKNINIKDATNGRLLL